jgi:hypothetical protein
MCFLWSRGDHWPSQQTGESHISHGRPVHKTNLALLMLYIWPSWCQANPTSTVPGTLSGPGPVRPSSSRGRWAGQVCKERPQRMKWEHWPKWEKALSQALAGVNACGCVNLLHGSFVLKGVSGGHSMYPSASRVTSTHGFPSRSDRFFCERARLGCSLFISKALHFLLQYRYTLLIRSIRQNFRE